jgi:hypothetical protein
VREGPIIAPAPGYGTVVVGDTEIEVPDQVKEELNVLKTLFAEMLEVPGLKFIGFLPRAT